MTDINNVHAGLAIIQVGFNDWRHPTSGNRRTPAQYKANLLTIVQSLKANGSDVLILNMHPILPQESDYVCPYFGLSSGCDSDATGNAFRDKILEVVTAESIHYVDTHSAFVTAGQPAYNAGSYLENVFNSASIDGLHPRPNGADFIAQLIVDYMDANSMFYSKIVCLGDSVIYGDGLIGGGTNTGQTIPARLKWKLNN